MLQLTFVGDSSEDMFKTEKPGAEIMDPIDEMDSDKPSELVVLLQTS